VHVYTKLINNSRNSRVLIVSSNDYFALNIYVYQVDENFPIGPPTQLFRRQFRD
jgi:hypothetical protein